MSSDNTIVQATMTFLLAVVNNDMRLLENIKNFVDLYDITIILTKRQQEERFVHLHKSCLDFSFNL